MNLYQGSKSQMTDKTVTLSVTDGIATITFNRPDAMNTLDEALSRDMIEACERAAAMTDLRGVVLTGAGKAFMAGGDISDFGGMIAAQGPAEERRSEVERRIDLAHKALKAMKAIPVPVIARIHGACAGIGLSFALHCDLALAAEEATLTTAYIGIGLSPDGGMTHALIRRVGELKALELLLGTPRLTGVEAAKLKMVNAAVPLEQLDGAIMFITEGLKQGPALAIRRMTSLVRQARDNDLEAQLDLEAQSFADCAMTADFAEGVSAFLERRKPDFG
ncbi:MAG: enoyl-CoA hydratase/isomerase family protein [Alphaproteobacteria bacterium]